MPFFNGSSLTRRRPLLPAEIAISVLTMGWLYDVANSLLRYSYRRDEHDHLKSAKGLDDNYIQKELGREQLFTPANFEKISIFALNRLAFGADNSIALN